MNESSPQIVDQLKVAVTNAHARLGAVHWVRRAPFNDGVEVIMLLTWIEPTEDGEHQVRSMELHIAGVPLVSMFIDSVRAALTAAYAPKRSNQRPKRQRR